MAEQGVDEAIVFLEAVEKGLTDHGVTLDEVTPELHLAYRAVDYWLSNENGEPVQTLTTEVLQRKQARALKALKALDWKMT